MLQSEDVVGVLRALPKKKGAERMTWHARVESSASTMEACLEVSWGVVSVHLARVKAFHHWVSPCTCRK